MTSLRRAAWLLFVPSLAFAELPAGELKKVEPENGAPKIGPVNPTWCDDIEAASGTPEYALRALGRSTETKDLDGNGKFQTPTSAPCVAPEDPVMQQQLGFYLQRWANLTGQSADELVELMAARAKDDDWQKARDEACKPLEDVPSEASPREAAMIKMRGYVLGCYDDRLGGAQENALWEIDRVSAPPSQLAETYFVLRCIGEPDVKSDWNVFHFATCRADAKQLDLEKLKAELAAENASSFVSITARQALQMARFRAAILEKALQAKVAKDPDLKTVLIDAPEKGWKAWEAEYAANKAIFDEAHAYEDKYTGPRKSAAKGCLKPAYALLKKYTAGLKGNNREEWITNLTTSTGAALLEYLWSCNEAEGREFPATGIKMVIEAGLPRRGPRFAQLAAMAEALGKVTADRPKFPVTGAMIGGNTVHQNYPVGRNHADFREPAYNQAYTKASVVVKVSTKGEKTTVQFKTDRWTEDELECKETNRIAMFERDGTPIYHRNCHYTGRKVQKESASEPFYNYPEVVDGIAAGTFVRYITGSKYVDRVFDGIPIEVYSDKGQKKLVALFGLRVK